MIVKSYGQGFIKVPEKLCPANKFFVAIISPHIQIFTFIIPYIICYVKSKAVFLSKTENGLIHYNAQNEEHFSEISISTRFTYSWGLPRLNSP